MHIPDGFIADPRIWGGCYAVSLATVVYAARQARTRFDERTPLTAGMTGAFLFAAQMFNFPIVGGTSGHLLGGALACVLLGGWTGVLVTAMVLALQSLVFQDGGITALGANVFNMAIAGGGGAYLLFRLFAPLLPSRRARRTVLGVCAAVGVLLAAALAALEIGLSGVVPVGIALKTMLAVHLVIGAVEGVATVAIVSALESTRPDLVRGFEPGALSPVQWGVAVSGLVAFTLAAVLFASSAPDGLEHAAAALGFESRAGAALTAPFPDYALRGYTSFLSKAAVAVGGVALAGAAAALVARIVNSSRRRERQ